MSVDAWISILITIGVFAVLQFRRGAPVDLLFLGALMAVTLAGVITPTEALTGFANPAVITIGALLAVAAGLRATGVLDWVGQKLLGSAKTERQALHRLAITLITTSAFLLNTALVAMMVPVVMEWCRRRNLSPSRLMMPVSYLAILGGVCSLVGTSTTLIVNSILEKRYEAEVLVVSAMTDVPEEERLAAESFMQGLEPLGVFESGKVGLPCAILGPIVWLTV